LRRYAPVRTLTALTIEQTPTWPPFPETQDTDDFSDVLPTEDDGRVQYGPCNQF
jgi:hypothetical protein